MSLPEIVSEYQIVRGDLAGVGGKCWKVIRGPHVALETENRPWAEHWCRELNLAVSFGRAAPAPCGHPAACQREGRCGWCEEQEMRLYYEGLHIAAHNHLLMPGAYKHDGSDVVISGIVRLQGELASTREAAAAARAGGG